MSRAIWQFVGVITNHRVKFIYSILMYSYLTSDMLQLVSNFWQKMSGLQMLIDRFRVNLLFSLRFDSLRSLLAVELDSDLYRWLFDSNECQDQR